MTTITRTAFNEAVRSAADVLDGEQQALMEDWLATNPTEVGVGSFESCPATQANLVGPNFGAEVNTSPNAEQVVKFAIKFDRAMMKLTGRDWVAFSAVTVIE